tara:strand:+ start:141 stop:557 length:417 start_codon:yes stop_codon:yes gene_type:complete
MFRKNKSSVLGSPHDENTLPLINITFLLLVYFIILGTWHKNEPVDFEYATSSTAKPIKNEGLEITITGHGLFIINGKKYDADELVAQLNSFVIRKYNRTIAIKVDKESKMGVIIKAISIFKRIGFVKLALITKQNHPH